MNSDEARAMRDAAASAGVVNLIGHEFRFYRNGRSSPRQSPRA